MKHPRFLLALACAASFTCVSSGDEPDTEQDADDPATEPVPIARWDGGGDAPGEVIHVEGDAPPGSQGGAPWGPGPGGPNQHPDNGGGGGGGRPSSGAMAPEPDRNKDRKSCYDWCDWSKRQCIKWCRKKYPYPRWDQQNQCIKYRCDKDPDPDIGLDACRSDCQRRFPERPITATWDAL